MWRLRRPPGDPRIDHRLPAFLLLAEVMCYAVHIGHFKAEADDPLRDSPEGRLMGDFGAKGRYSRSGDDLAVVEFCAKSRAGLAYESDLVCAQSTRNTPRSPLTRHATPRRDLVRCVK